MRKIRWGVLGAAKIATEKVIPAMQRGQWSEVTAIASRDLEKARAAAAKLGIAKAYGSYEELLADEDIDAIYNPLPNHLHVPWTIKAAERGKHVLCEKPIALSADEARQLLAVRDRTGVKIQEAFMVRTHPQWLAVKELVSSGRIGEVRAMLGAFSYTNRDPANIRNRPELGGGALMDIGCYLVNTSRFIFGREPLRVTGAIAARPRHGHRSADVDSARLRHGTRRRHLQHADGVLSAPADLRHHRPHRDADSVQRAARPAVAHHRRHRRGPLRRRDLAASMSTSATSTRSRAICSRRRSSTTPTCPRRSKTP